VSAPLIAIVGSVDPARQYDPPLRDPQQAIKACEELGQELAGRGCRIVVYTSAPGFIEAHVVRGYVASGQARPESIEVHHPQRTGIDFPELASDRAVFKPRPDDSPDWEVSFYRSLRRTDGVLLVGGGWSGYITGLIALAYRLPVVTVAAFGGSAERAWEVLNRDRGHATEEEVAAMAGSWHAGSAAKLIASLVAAHDRQLGEARERERRSRSFQRRSTVAAIVAAVLFIASVATIPVSSAWEAGSTGLLAALHVAPLLAGTAGSLVRVVFDADRDWAKTAMLGLAAGGVASLLFVATQLVASPDILDGPGAHRLLFFAVPMAFIAGFTFDAVYSKLRATDVIDASPMRPGSGGG
jgi:hypothetical protein